MISEGSCDTQVWSNDDENTDLITGINYSLQYIQIHETVHLNCNNISQYYYLYYIYDQMNAALVKTQTSYWSQTMWW